MRINEQTKPFLELIWNIEKSQIEGETLSKKNNTLINDSSEIPTQKGNLYKILSRIEPPTESSFIPDNDSISGRNQERAIETLAREMNNLHRVETADPEPLQGLSEAF